jgi:hypothetical protein
MLDTWEERAAEGFTSISNQESALSHQDWILMAGVLNQMQAKMKDFRQLMPILHAFCRSQWDQRVKLNMRSFSVSIGISLERSIRKFTSTSRRG